MRELLYPAVQPPARSGDEPLRDSRGGEVTRLADFWRWAHSDLLTNTERGILAEYIVACALDVHGGTRIAWDRYDLVTKEGFTVEVKTSGYLQSWGQKAASKLVFGIRPTLGWDSTTNVYGTTRARRADIYVFCVYKHREQETADPLDLRQWDFYLLPTRILNEKVGMQKSISLSSLLKIGATYSTYTEMHGKLLACMHGL